MDDLPAAIAETVRALVDKLPLSFLRQLDELGGDAIRMRRFRRLLKVLEEAQRIAEARGFSPDDMRLLADHIGLPWMDKASLRDDEELQTAWANLFLAITTGPEEELHGTYVRILGEMNPWDCRVLDHMAKNGVVKHYEAAQFVFIRIREEDAILAIDDEIHAQDRTRISIENLVRLGCLQRIVPAPVETGGQVYGALREYLSLTVTGLNLYSVSSGNELESFVPNRTDDEVIDQLGLRESLIRRSTHES